MAKKKAKKKKKAAKKKKGAKKKQHRIVLGVSFGTPNFFWIDWQTYQTVHQRNWALKSPDERGDNA